AEVDVGHAVDPARVDDDVRAVEGERDREGPRVGAPAREERGGEVRGRLGDRDGLAEEHGGHGGAGRWGDRIARGHVVTELGRLGPVDLEARSEVVALELGAELLGELQDVAGRREVGRAVAVDRADGERNRGELLPGGVTDELDVEVTVHEDGASERCLGGPQRVGRGGGPADDGEADHGPQGAADHAGTCSGASSRAGWAGRRLGRRIMNAAYARSATATAVTAVPRCAPSHSETCPTHGTW